MATPRDADRHADHLLSVYSAPNVKGRLFSGAGGGFLMVISDKPVASGHLIKINNEFSAKPFPSDKVGDEPKPM